MTKRVQLAKPQAAHPLSPAERAAKLLAFRPGYSHNFALIKQPTKAVAVAPSWMRTA